MAFRGRYRFSLGFTLNFSTYWNKYILKFDYTYLNQISCPRVSTKYQNYLKHKADLISILELPWHINFSFVLSYQKRLFQSPYLILDTKIEKKIKLLKHIQCKFFVEGKNLLDADYEDIDNLSMPDRKVLAGLEIV